jgi:hypothetical protein
MPSPYRRPNTVFIRRIRAIQNFGNPVDVIFKVINGIGRFHVAPSLLSSLIARFA